MTRAARAPLRTAGSLQAVLLLLTATLSVMTLALLAPVLPQLKARFEVEAGAPWLVPMIITMPSLCLVVGSPLVGFLADRIGRRRQMLFVALIFYAIVGTAPLYLDGFAAILVSRVLVGFAEAGVLTLSTALIGDYFAPEARDRWLGLQSAITSSSAVLLFAVGGALGSFGWRGPFVLYGSSLLLLVAIWLGTCNMAVIGTTASTEPVASSGRAIPWRHVATVCGITLFTALMFFSVQLYASVAFGDLGVRAPAAAGLLTGIGTIGSPVGAVVFRLMIRRSSRQRIALAFALAAFGFAVISFADRPAMLVAGIFLAQFGCGILLPTLLVRMVQGVPLSGRTRSIGIWQATFQLGQFLCPFLLAPIIAGAGGLLPAFRAVAVAAIIAFVLAAMTARTRAPSAADRATR